MFTIFFFSLCVRVLFGVITTWCGVCVPRERMSEHAFYTRFSLPCVPMPMHIFIAFGRTVGRVGTHTHTHTHIPKSPLLSFWYIRMPIAHCPLQSVTPKKHDMKLINGQRLCPSRHCLRRHTPKICVFSVFFVILDTRANEWTGRGDQHTTNTRTHKCGVCNAVVHLNLAWPARFDGAMCVCVLAKSLYISPQLLL